MTVVACDCLDKIGAAYHDGWGVACCSRFGNLGKLGCLQTHGVGPVEFENFHMQPGMRELTAFAGQKKHSLFTK